MLILASREAVPAEMVAGVDSEPVSKPASVAVTSLMLTTAALGIEGGIVKAEFQTKSVRFKAKTVRFKGKPDRFKGKPDRFIDKDGTANGSGSPSFAGQPI